MIMTDKMNTDGFFAAELSLDDLENVAGGMKPEYEQSLRNDIRNARNSGYSKDEFIIVKYRILTATLSEILVFEGGYSFHRRCNLRK
jgi:hypothetical protein